jgi:hypothetical protein
MVEVAAEDLRASPCVVCGQPGAFVGVWTPTASVIAQELGGDPARSRQLIYRLCGPCGRRGAHDKAFVATVEHAVLRLWRSGCMHRIRDGVSIPKV